jgi:hypothetical protein
MKAAVAEAEAKRRLAAFMDRTSRIPWMRERLGSFEVALILGLRNLLTEAGLDEAEGRNTESYAAHYSFLYGMLSSLRHLFFWEALQARIRDRSVQLKRAPEMEDAEAVLQELEVMNNAAVRDDVQARFRRLLAGKEATEARQKVMDQAKALELLHTLKEIPKA